MSFFHYLISNQSLYLRCKVNRDVCATFMKKCNIVAITLFFVQTSVLQLPIKFANMLSTVFYVVTSSLWVFFLIIIQSHLVEQRIAYYRNTFYNRYVIDKLTINACQVLLLQTFFLKCWFLHSLGKIDLNELCFSEQFYCYK